MFFQKERRLCTTGYKFILLDTLPSMIMAHKLYKKLGFVEIAAYYNSTIKDTHYMRCDLGEFAEKFLKTL